jgi:hypothetical protein
MRAETLCGRALPGTYRATWKSNRAGDMVVDGIAIIAYRFYIRGAKT